jgi:hypothetical protein
METTTAVIEALERAPDIVVPLVGDVPPVLLKRRPTPTKWSAHEHACYLVVVRRLFFDRLDQMLASPAPMMITPYDPGQSDPDDLLLGMDLDRSLQQYIDDGSGCWSRVFETSRCQNGIARPSMANTATTAGTSIETVAAFGARFAEESMR